MKRALLTSVAAFALAAGTTVALSQGQGGGAAGQGAGGNTPMANPSAPSGGQDTPGTTKQKGAQDRAIPEKQKSTQQSPGGKGTTTSQAQEEKGAPATKQSQEKGAPTTKQSQEKSGQPSTTQQTQQSQEKSGQPTTKQSQEKSGQPSTTQQSQTPSAGGSKQGTAQTTTGGGSSVSFTTEQKTKIRQTVLTGSAPRVTNVNFDIKVGTVVPRTVRVAPLPVTIVEIEPQWRGYMYFVYHDEIIVVEPGSLRIVAVIEV
jgi:hypothetical protein